MANIKILGIAGSLRESSYNVGLLRAAQELLPEGVEMEIASIADLPFYDADIDGEGAPEPVVRLKRQIAEADAVLIATPEYNYSVPGVLKNAIDWVSRPPMNSLVGKPVALMGASTGNFGTVRAQLHLRQILVYTDSLVLSKPELYIMRAATLFDEKGNLTDEATRERVERLVEALVEWTLRLNPPQPEAQVDAKPADQQESVQPRSEAAFNHIV